MSRQFVGTGVPAQLEDPDVWPDSDGQTRHILNGALIRLRKGDGKLRALEGPRLPARGLVSYSKLGWWVEGGL